MTPPARGPVRWLDDLAEAPVGLVGGKAAGLAALVAAGLPVPTGFVTWTPEGARDGYAVLTHRCDTDHPLVAVRSSSPVEDGATRSAAGLLPTELGVRGSDAVAAAVERIVAAEANLGAGAGAGSGAGAEAPGSAERQAERFPVLVQVMVKAIAAGVSFSAHPVTGARDRIVIEAVHGLGVLLTDGHVVPEHVVVQRHTGAVLTARAGRQRLVASVTDAGLTHIECLDHMPTDAAVSGPAGVLTSAQIDAVVTATVRAETALTVAADVEWAFDGAGQLWVLQGRPITTLPATSSHPVAGFQM